MRPTGWYVLVAGLLILFAFAPSTAFAAGPTILSARLAPAEETPVADPAGTGSATFTIDPERGVLGYRVVFAHTARPITSIALCAGSTEGRTYPIPAPCGFILVPALPGGASPVEGSAPIGSVETAGLDAPGWSAFVRLSSSAGPELEGYLGPIGYVDPRAPATDTVASATPRSADGREWVLAAAVALIAFTVLSSRPAGIAPRG